jgi:hypothetical protein
MYWYLQIMSNTNNYDKDKDISDIFSDDYFLKSEIVPPVCPQCPNCPSSNTGVCSSCGGCGGNGTERCGDCGGDGETDCYDCDGTGEVETNELELMYSYICTWSSEVENQCYLNERTGEPAMSEYDFDRLSDEYITLFYTEESAELKNFVEINQVYCVSYWDEPKLSVGSGKFLQIKWNDSGEFDYYRA